MLKLKTAYFSKLQRIFGDNATYIYNKKPVPLQHYINGEWRFSKNYLDIPNPLNSEILLHHPKILEQSEFELISNSLKTCHKSGLHNPFKNPERYRGWGEILQKVVTHLHDKEIHQHFFNLVQTVMPKHSIQVEGELIVTRKFLENFIGDNSRFGLRGFTVAGDHEGQISQGFRFPYGPVALITPFNFPYEIPVLQLIGGLISGNKVLVKGDERVSIVLEHFIRLLEHCGLYKDSLNLVHCSGHDMEQILIQNKNTIRQVHFTGSSKVATRISQVMDGKVRFEDSGFNWKILGPDVGSQQEVDYVASQCDQDAYATGGQKCSAQSVLLIHQNWRDTNLLERIQQLAEQRSIANLTNSPLLSVSNSQIQEYVRKILQIKGSKILFGGNVEKTTNKVYEKYGTFQPTAIYIPFEELSKEWNLDILTTEIFGPVQIVTYFGEKDKQDLVKYLEVHKHHLTAGIVSNDVKFNNYILKNTVNGVTYVGKRARTTGAPQNHWFGPSNDPRGSGIGTIEAILGVWSSHREIVYDYGKDDDSYPLINQS